MFSFRLVMAGREITSKKIADLIRNRPRIYKVCDKKKEITMTSFGDKALSRGALFGGLVGSTWFLSENKTPFVTSYGSKVSYSKYVIENSASLFFGGVTGAVAGIAYTACYPVTVPLTVGTSISYLYQRSKMCYNQLGGN